VTVKTFLKTFLNALMVKILLKKFPAVYGFILFFLIDGTAVL
jgi:hypothetical protein